jgi:hypothetical protein
MKTLRQHIIDLEYENILIRLKDGRLYGDPINMQDIKELVIASYYAGNSSEKLLWRRGELEELESELFFEYVENKARRIR